MAVTESLRMSSGGRKRVFTEEQEKHLKDAYAAQVGGLYNSVEAYRQYCRERNAALTRITDKQIKNKLSQIKKARKKETSENQTAHTTVDTLQDLMKQQTQTRRRQSAPTALTSMLGVAPMEMAGTTTMSEGYHWYDICVEGGAEILVVMFMCPVGFKTTLEANENGSGFVAQMAYPTMKPSALFKVLNNDFVDSHVGQACLKIFPSEKNLWNQKLVYRMEFDRQLDMGTKETPHFQISKLNDETMNLFIIRVKVKGTETHKLENEVFQLN